MIYLLDTNIISNMIKYPAGPSALRHRDLLWETSATSVVVAAELRYGYRKIGSNRLEDQVETVLASVGILDWDEPCSKVYAEVRVGLERRGEVIGLMDMMIAAHALALDAVLVTDNEREFRRVAGLKVENWIR